MKKYFSGLFLLAALNTIGYANEIKYIDPSNLDIAGIQLGMNQQEAFSALVHKLKIPKNAIKKVMPDIYYALYKKDKIVINFTATTLDPKHPKYVVSTVSYITPNTAANQALMKKNVLKKYGKPTTSPCTNSSACYAMTWCAGHGHDCDMQQGMLSYTYNKLQLSTLKYRTALQKLQAEQQSGSSAF